MTRLGSAVLSLLACLAVLAPARPAAAQVVIVEEQPPPPPPPQRRVVVVETETTQGAQAPPQPAPEPEPHPDWSPQSQAAREPPPEPRFGVHGFVAGVAGRNLHMAGTTGAFRFRPQPHVGVDLGLGIYGGRDYNGLDRVEIPMTADLLLFVNPENALQLYFIGGLGISLAHAEGRNVHTGNLQSRDFGYVGAEVGVGLEWRLTRHFALNTDLRGFLRHRVDDNDTQPEFIEYDSRGRPTGRTTDTSAGGLLTLGATFYF